MNAYVSVIRRYVQSHAFCSSLDSQKILHCVPNKKNKPQLLVITSENVNQLFGPVYSVQWTWSIDDFRSITPHLFQPAQPMWNFNTTMVYCNWNNSVHCTFHRPDIFLLSNYQCWPSKHRGKSALPQTRENRWLPTAAILSWSPTPYRRDGMLPWHRLSNASIPICNTFVMKSTKTYY